LKWAKMAQPNEMPFWGKLMWVVPGVSRAGFRVGVRGPRPLHASHHRVASLQTAHILFLANESADDLFVYSSLGLFTGK